MSTVRYIPMRNNSIIKEELQDRVKPCGRVCTVMLIKYHSHQKVVVPFMVTIDGELCHICRLGCSPIVVFVVALSSISVCSATPGRKIFVYNNKNSDSDP